MTASREQREAADKAIREGIARLILLLPSVYERFGVTPGELFAGGRKKSGVIALARRWCWEQMRGKTPSLAQLSTPQFGRIMGRIMGLDHSTVVLYGKKKKPEASA